MKRTIKEISLSMSKRGMTVDRNDLTNEIERLSEKVSELQEQIVLDVAAASDTPESKINLNSSKLMTWFIYDFLNFPVLSVTEAKRLPSLELSVLEKFRGESKSIDSYIDWRSSSRTLSLLKNLDKELGDFSCAHSTFNPNGTKSGRFISEKPNLLNINSDYTRFFCASFDGESLFLNVDIVQAEYALACQMCGETVREDFHSAVAEYLQITRASAKVVNLGIMYGMTAYGLAKHLSCSKDEARLFISQWHKMNPILSKYMEQVRKAAVINGYVKTIVGRTIYADMRDSEGRAFNLTTQASMADVIKAIMVDVDEYCRECMIPRAHIVLNTYDGLVIEVPASIKNSMHVLAILDLFKKPKSFPQLSFAVKYSLDKRWVKP